MEKTNDGTKGGWLVGKRHYDKDGKPIGGIPAVVGDSKRPVELEGGEVIINREASKKYWKELSKINQSAGNGVPIKPQDVGADEDPEEYKEGGKVIEFNPNRIPNKRIYNYAKSIKEQYPKVWGLGGNIFGNEAFKNLERVIKRGYWTDNEEWMYIKWRSFVARHKGDFRIAGVIAMLKWVDKVDKGWDYMKNLIEEEIEKRYPKKKKGGVVTYKKKYNKKYGYKENESHDLEEVSKDTGVSKKGLRQIYNKGVGAYKTNPQSVRPTVKSKEQWAMGRVYSAVMGGKAARVDANELKMENGGNLYHLGGDMSKHLAPNGKPSNLTHEQWHLVRTPEFKAWFGDWENDPENASKVVDENGEPMVVYHSSPNFFDVFSKKKSKHGVFHFGTIGQALERLIYFIEEEGFDLSPYVDYNVDDDDDNIFWGIVYYILMSYYLNEEKLDTYFKEYYDTKNNGNKKYNTLKSLNIKIKKELIKKELEKYNIKPYFLVIKKLGKSLDMGEEWEFSNLYDGYTYLNLYEGNKKEYSYLVFQPNQIKLADGTNTTFDSSNPDIRFAEGGIVLPAQGTMLTKDKKLKLDYKKVGNNYEFVVYEGETNPVHVLVMDYNQFINYLYEEGYIDDKKMEDGGNVDGEMVVYRGGTEMSKYFSTSKNIASDYAKNRNGEVKEYVILKTAKIIDYNDIPNIKYKGINDYNIEQYSSSKDLKTFYDIDLEEDYSKAELWAKNKGYDVIKFPTEREIRVINMNVVKEKMENGGATSWDKIASSSARFRPSETVVFEPPLVGLNGAKLTSYKWAYEMTMLPNWEGELVGKKVSDWTQAEMSAETGRGIVHQYTIELPNGEVKTVSSESVPILLGYQDRTQAKVFGNLATASKTLAKQQMKLAIMEAQKKEYDTLVAKFEKEPKPEVKIAEFKDLPFITQKVIERESESGKVPSFTYFKMGDAIYSQDNQYDYNKSSYTPAKNADKKTIEQLTYNWIANRVKESGAENPRGLYDLKNRVQRQKRKVENMLNPKMENGGNFTSYSDAMEWIERKSDEFGGKNKFLSSNEYRQIYPIIKNLYDVEKSSYSKNALKAMQDSNVNFGDNVFYDYATPFGVVEEYSGQIVNRNGIPYVKLSEGQKTISGATSVRWHNGWKKNNKMEDGGNLERNELEKIKERYNLGSEYYESENMATGGGISNHKDLESEIMKQQFGHE